MPPRSDGRVRVSRCPPLGVGGWGRCFRATCGDDSMRLIRVRSKCFRLTCRLYLYRVRRQIASNAIEAAANPEGGGAKSQRGAPYRGNPGWAVEVLPIVGAADLTFVQSRAWPEPGSLRAAGRQAAARARCDSHSRPAHVGLCAASPALDLFKVYLIIEWS